MTSYEFEVAAKNAILDKRKKDYPDISISDISIVFFTYTLGNIKATLIDGQKNTRYYEVTYNRARNEMYVDEYVKINKTTLTGDDICTTVRRFDLKDGLGGYNS